MFSSILKFSSLSLLVFALSSCAPDKAATTPEASDIAAPQLELGDVASPEQIAAELASAPLGINDGNSFISDSIESLSGPTLIIVVSKSKQRLWIYEYGSDSASYSWPVSTGSERKKCPPNGKCYFAHTPSGTFTPSRAYRYYESKLWKAKMNFAVFFNGGIALHATYGADHLSKIGKKDSGGCVRQREENAEITFNTVKKHGMRNTRVIIKE